jgi:hypothetical protein
MNSIVNFIRHLWRWRPSFISKPLVEADALVLKLYPTGIVKNGMQQAQLLLQVTPKHGRIYIAECKSYFSEKDFIELGSGNNIKIYYPRGNPMKIHWKQHETPSDQMSIFHR